MKQQPGPGEAHGPSWRDVQTFMDDVMDTHKGAVVVELTTIPLSRHGSARGLWVRLSWHEKGQQAIGAEISSGGPWPTSEHRTMPALIYALCYTLEGKLTDRAGAGKFMGGPPRRKSPAADVVPLEPPAPETGG